MSVCFVCCVLVNCLVKQFTMCVGLVTILLLNVMVCVCCACDPNECLSAPSICFVCVFVCRKLSPHLGV